MNVIIPLCGKGERFLPQNKPFVKVFDKTILGHVVDSLKGNKIHIIVNNRTYHENLESYGTIINIEKETAGATETAYLGLKRAGIVGSESVLLVDGDNFYTCSLVDRIKEYPNENQIVCFADSEGEGPAVFSYIEFDENGWISKIREKERISKYANTGAYYFNRASSFLEAAEIVMKDTRYHFKGEPYISSVISYMLDMGAKWKATCIPKESYYSLGTPAQVQAYKGRTYCFLFDLDGTLVNTDKTYYKVWEKILLEYNIHLTDDIYKKYIYSNSDAYVKNALLKNISISVEDIMINKEFYFRDFSDTIELIGGADSFLKQLKRLGHRVAVVTNSNRDTAEFVLHATGLNRSVDCLIIGGECERAKPYPDPYLKAVEFFGADPKKCFVFEDSHNGLLSAKGCGPKCIVGVGRDREGLKASGAQVVFCDYNEILLENLISFKEDKIEYYKACIQKSLRGLRDISINPVTLKGGFIADVYSVSFAEKAEKVHKAIFKVENKNESMLNKVAHQLDLYNRENYFYETLSAHIPIDIPKFYGLVRDDDYNVIGILLEDLRKEGFVLNLDLNLEPVDTSLAIIESIAKMHAACWGKKLDSRERFDKLKKCNDMRFQDFIDKRLPAFMDKWGHMFNDAQKKVFQEMGLNYNQIQNALSEEPLTLVHGDVKSPNLFFDKEKKPYFIDWQYICYGKGVQDLVFFMIESFSKESMAIYFHLFKEYYYVKLLEYGVKGYSREAYNRDFKNAAYYFPYFVAIWFGTTANEDLIDVNFPYFFIDRLVAFYEQLVH